MVKYLTDAFFENKKIDTTFVSTTKDVKKYFDDTENVVEFGIDEKNNKKNKFKISILLLLAIRREDPDVILCHSAYTDLFFIRVACLFIWNTPKIIVVSHGNDFGFDKKMNYGVAFNYRKRMLIKFLSTKVDLVICPSEFQKTQVIKILKRKIRTVVIPNGLPGKLDVRKTRQKVKKDPVRLVIMSSSRPIKRLEYALLTLISVARKYDNFEIYVTSEDEDLNKTIRSAYESNKLTHIIHFVGHVRGVKKEALLNKMDVLLLPSLYENCPLVILEAFYFGLVPIASNVGGISELVKDKETGILFDPFIPDELESSVGLVLSNINKLDILKKSSRKEFSKYSISHISRVYINNINRVL